MSLINKFQEIFLSYDRGAKKRGINTKAVITTSASKGVFILSSGAKQLLNIGKKDRVLIFDMKNEATINAERFFITKGFTYQEKGYGMKINGSNSFMDMSVYNLLLANDISLDDCSSDELLKRGLAILRNTEKRQNVFTSKQTVIAELVPYTETLADGTVVSLFSIAPGMPEQEVFRFMNPEFIDNPVLV